MKRLVLEESMVDIFGMANLVPKRTGLPCKIWSEHAGILEDRPDNTPSVKIKYDNASVSVSIEPEPKIFAKSGNIKKTDMDKIEKGIEYVGRNYDLFLRYYEDTDDSFDDREFEDALAARGEYKI